MVEYKATKDDVRMLLHHYQNLYATRDSQTNTLYAQDVRGIPGKALYTVPTLTLDSLLVRQGRKPSLIKIDAEGAEGEVLKGAEITIAEYRPKIFFESFADGKIEECKSLLTRHSYEVKKVSGWNYTALPSEGS